MQHQTTLTQQALIAGATLGILASILLLRAGEPLLISATPYEHIAGALGPTPTMYQHLLGIIISLSSPLIASISLPLILGAISAVLFANLLGNLGLPNRKQLIGVGILILSPAFINTSIISDSQGLLLALQLAAANLLLTNTLQSRAIASITSAIIGTFGATHLIAIFGFAIMRYHDDPKTLLRYILPTLLLTAALITIVQPTTIPPHLTNPISDLGGEGITIFAAALAIIGIINLLSHQPAMASALIISTPLSLLWADTLIYAALITSGAAAHGITIILSTRWQLQTLKQYTLLIIACGIIFGTFSYAMRLSHAEPDHQMMSALAALRIHADENSIVVTEHADTPYVTSITGLRAITDPSLLEASTIASATETLRAHNITHIYLSSRSSNRGIREPLQDTSAFISIYNDGSYAIWTRTQ
ncbi:hypothetical protein HY641_00615 [Candidatus Woesearchaeota archaeon]|nr:hypothetical protein [Candidatus Woesearchaeota archaeon]